MTREEALTHSVNTALVGLDREAQGLCALDHRGEAQAINRWKHDIADALSTWQKALRSAPAAPGVPEVGSKWRCLSYPNDVIEVGKITVGWQGDLCGMRLPDFLLHFEPVPAPPAPEPRWIVARLCRGRNPYYCGGRDDDGKAVFSSERAGGTTWDEALGILGDDCERQPEDWWTYRIEPAGRVQA